MTYLPYDILSSAVIGRASPTIAATVLILTSGMGGQTPSPTPKLLESTVGDYCSDCHSDQLKTGGVSLEHASSANVAAQGALLERVLHKLRAGEMPPQGNPG